MNKQKQPNILLIMADQIAAPALPMYGHKVVKTPHLAALASAGVVFDAAYCNFPVCGPSRFSMLTGMHATRVGAYDNASEFPASQPTLPYYLRAHGYHTALSGKMHFIGPDQQHGYQERLTTDIIGSDFALTAEWSAPEPSSPAGATLKTILDAGPCIRSLQLDYDDEVAHCAVQKLYDLARAPEQAPFFLTVSFTHPHAPFTAPQDCWDLYRDDEIDLPAVAALPEGSLDMQTVWLNQSRRSDLYKISDGVARNARHAYYGMITYIDRKVGELLTTLRLTGLDTNTVVIFLGDHGEMMGERGMWFKSTFFEWSARVPLIVSFPGRFPAQRRAEVVSLVDVLPTLLDLAEPGAHAKTVDALDGRSLVTILEGKRIDDWPNIVISEYTADGVCTPCRMIRRGFYKYIYIHGQASLLYRLDSDPQERQNLSGVPEFAAIERELREALLRGWDPEMITADIVLSQRRRLFIQNVTAGRNEPLDWSYSARADDQQRYVRGAKASEKKSRRRFPYIPPSR
jgi:choline-sulfatase